ncbi:MAG TPA: SGNH/GDSL hydrolase family protein [Rudaea sp.]|jgi:lysophospholipase L1-like esterase|uniref:SGNH/GDSL hydrolase family protein n=1 Tax=Rudaea sp. TaxID=2136325 RepID=UPI002F92D5B4
MSNRLRSFSLGLLGLVLAFASVGVVFAQDAADPWQKEIAALVAGDAANPPPQHGVLFVGSSSIRLWTTLAQDFPGIPTINRGFGGSRIADSTRYVGRIVAPYQPNVIVLYAGDNDIAEQRTSSQTIDDFKAFVARVRRDLPQVPIVFISIKPSVSRAALWPQMRAANEGIAAWAKTQAKVIYLDVASKMLDPDGKPRPELLREDGLHMTPAGYAIWIAALKPVLAQFGFVSR